MIGRLGVTATNKYTEAFLYSDCLYFLWHGISLYSIAFSLSLLIFTLILFLLHLYYYLSLQKSANLGIDIFFH